MQSTLIELFERDLRKLIDEINAYQNEANIWLVRNEISNSAGNLCLHLVGNLNHFIGATLGKNGYIRTREVEFSAKNVPRQTLIEGVENVIAVVNKVLTEMTDTDFASLFPLEKHGRTVTTTYMVLHLLTHLNYHIGQINYHRRLIDNE